jgi:NADPH:quinone reductase-like Zn-dependent oxidoreductase
LLPKEFYESEYITGVNYYMSDTMKAWRFHEFGSPRRLKLEDIPVPQPRPDEVLVKLDYASLNPADVFLIVGQYPGAAQPPLIPGRDGCGVVEIAAKGGRFHQGDMVVMVGSELGVRRDGTFAQYVTIPERFLSPLPQGWTTQQGAAAPLVHLTASYVLRILGKIKPNNSVLITGASGGVGTAALIQAKSYSAKVAALSRDPQKRERLTDLGADAVFDPEDEDLVKNVIDFFDGRGADIVVENIAGEFLAQSVKMCAEEGMIALVGMLGGIRARLYLPEILFRRIRLLGVFLGQSPPEQAHILWQDVVELLQKTGRRPLVDSEFPLNQLREAFSHMRSGPMGKVLLGPLN